MHLFRSIFDLDLQVLGIINACYGITGLFINAENNYAASGLIGKARQRIIEFFGRASQCLFDFDMLLFTFLTLDLVDQFE